MSQSDLIQNDRSHVVLTVPEEGLMALLRLRKPSSETIG